MADRFELELITTFTEQGLDATVAKIKSELARLTAPTVSGVGTGGLINPGAAANQIKQLNDAQVKAERAIQQLQAAGQITGGRGSQAAELRRQITAQYSDLSKDPNFLRLQQQANKTANPPQLYTSRQQVQSAIQAQDRPTATAKETVEPATTAQLAKAQEGRVKQAAEVTREALAETQLAEYTAELATARKQLQAQVQEMLAVDGEYLVATSELAKSRKSIQAATQEELARDEEYVSATASIATSRKQLQAQLQEQLAADSEYLAATLDLAKSRKSIQAITQEELVGDGEYLAATTSIATARKQLQAHVQAELAADDEYIKATVDAAAARNEQRSAALAQSGPGSAAFSAATEVGVAQRIVKAQQKKAEAVELDTQENVRILADARAANQKLAEDTQKLANQREVEANGGSQVGPNGTPGQRLSASEKTRPGGGVVDPLSQQTFGQQFLQLSTRTAGYAISGTALYALADAARSTVNETTKLDYQFGLLKDQTNALGQGSQFTEFRQQILGIARDTGVAGGEVANVAFQLEGAFHNTTVAVKDTRAAMELVRTTSLSIDEITNDLTAISVAYGKSFDQIGDKVTALQTRYGVLGAQSVQAFGIVSAAAQQAGLTFNQTAEIIGAVSKASGGSADAIGSSLNAILPSIQNVRGQLATIYQGAANGKVLTQKQADDLVSKLAAGQTGQALLQILTDQEKLNGPQGQNLRNNLINTLAPRPSLQGTVAQLFQSAPEIIQGSNNSDAGALQQRFDSLSRTLPQELSRLGEVGRQIGMNLLNSGLLDALKALGAVLLAAANATNNLLELFTRLNDSSGHVVTDVLALAAAIKLLQLAVSGISGIGGLVGTVFATNADKIQKAADAQIALEGALNAKGFTSGVTPLANAATTGGAARTAEEIAASAGAAKLASDATRSAGGLSLFSKAVAKAESILGGFAVGGSAALGVKTLGGLAPESAAGAAAAGGALTLGVVAAGAVAGYYDVSETQKLQKQAADRRKQIQDQLSLPGYSPKALQAIANNPANQRPGYDPINGFANLQNFYKYDIAGTPTYAAEANKETPQRTQEYAQAANALNLFSGSQAQQLQDLVAKMQAGKGSKNTANQTRQLLGQLNAAQNQQIQDFLQNAQNQQQSLDTSGDSNLQNIADATARYQVGQESFSQYLQDLTKEIDVLTKLAKTDPKDIPKLLQGLQTQSSAINSSQQLIQQTIQAAQGAGGASPLQSFQQLSDVATTKPGGLNDLANQFPSQVGSRINISKLSDPQKRDLLTQLQGLENAGKAALQDAIQRGATPDQLAKIQSIFQLSPDELSALQAVQVDLFGAILDPGAIAPGYAGLQQGRQNDFAQAQANAQATIAKLYNPAAINSVNLGLAQKQLDEANASGDPTAIAQANAAKAQAQRQQQDTSDQVAQSRLALQQAQDANDPVAAARDQVAAGNLALSQARGNVAAANQARAQIAAANISLRQADQAVAEAKVNLLKAQNPLDALKQAQDDQQAADIAAKYAVGQAAQLQAQAQRLAADKAVQDALEAIAQSQYDIVIAQANAVGDTVKAAELNVEKARQALANAKTRGAGTAELNSLQVQVTQAQSQLNQTTIDTQEQIIQFQLSMLQITHAQAVAQLQQLLAQAQTPAQQRQIEEQIHQEQLTAGADLQYNLPTTLGLPTLYTARRLTQEGNSLGLGAQNASAGVITNDNRQIIITLNEATDGGQALQTIVDALNSPPTTGTYPRVY